MLRPEMEEILDRSRAHGWVLEPEAKRLFSLAGLEVPRFGWAKDAEEAVHWAADVGYPVVGKVISPAILHKSEKGGVVVDIRDEGQLRRAYEQFSRMEEFAGMLVEEMLSGVELIVGAKVDYQFGPVILLGMGGTGVEIYRDVALRMAPLEKVDVESMLQCLKGRRLLEGYREKKPINRESLTHLVLQFSGLVMDLHPRIESIDLNPVLCSETRAVIADARIMLKK
jgi:succinyl-CoA synthetase beta subunit